MGDFLLLLFISHKNISRKGKKSAFSKEKNVNWKGKQLDIADGHNKLFQYLNSSMRKNIAANHYILFNPLQT